MTSDSQLLICRRLCYPWVSRIVTLVLIFMVDISSAIELKYHEFNKVNNFPNSTKAFHFHKTQIYDQNNEQNNFPNKAKFELLDIPTTPTYQMYTVGGNGVAGSAADGAVATSSSVRGPYGLFIDTNMFLYFSEHSGNIVRKVNLITGITNIFAGNGESGNTGGGGPATSARISGPYGVSGTTSGLSFISSNLDNSVRVISSSGIINNYAGIAGTSSTTHTDLNGDGGPATSATLNRPALIAVDTSNNLFIADNLNYKVRKVDATTGKISTIAGIGLTGSTGDDGDATRATLNVPEGVFVSIFNKIYVSESNGNRIRVISTDNIITFFAGLSSGETSYVDNVPATSTGVSGPIGVWGDTVGNIYYCSSGTSHNYVRVVSGFSGIVTTIAGTGALSATSFISSGLALTIPILSPRGLHGDAQGRLYVADFSTATGGSSVRGIYTSTPQPTYSPVPSLTPTQMPSWCPTVLPSASPSMSPSRVPTIRPSKAPSNAPTKQPTTVPTSQPTTQPSFEPTTAPTVPVYQMYTVAGNGVTGAALDNSVTTSSSVNQPKGIFIDTSGAMLFFADYGNRRVRKIDLQAGITTIFAGSGSSGVSGDGGPATSAKFYQPYGVAGTTSGVVYVSDYGENCIRAVSSSGIITNIVGTGSASAVATDANGDGGQATSATVKMPCFLVVADAGNNLYFADSMNNKVRKVDIISGIISTIAGTGAAGSAGNDGFATSATINRPVDIFIDSVGKMYISELNGGRIRRVGTNNIILTFAGSSSGTLTYADNVPATSTGINIACGLWGDTIGNIYFSDIGYGFVRVISRFSGVVSTIAGDGTTSALVFVSNGPALMIPLVEPSGVRGDWQGRLFVSDACVATGGSSIRGIYANTQQPTVSPTITPTIQPSNAPTVPVYQMYTVAGNGIAGSAGDNAVATSSSVNEPQGLFLDSSSVNLYFADFTCVRKINFITSISTIFAGSTTGDIYSGDNGPATSATFKLPIGVFAATSGVVYITDFADFRVRKVSTDGIITLYVGAGDPGVATAANGDGGAATSAQICRPQYMAMDTGNNLYVADLTNSKVRKIDVITGIISTVVGRGVSSSGGDGGFATSAGLNRPLGLVIDTSGVLYISEYAGKRVRIVNTNGIINLFSGRSDGGSTLVDFVAATSSGLKGPSGIWANTVGDVFICDNLSFRLRAVSKFSGLVYTIAGNVETSASQFIYYGPATSIPLLKHLAVVGDADGKLFVSDMSPSTGGSSIRGIYASTQSPTGAPTTAYPTISPTTTYPTFIPTISLAPSSVPTLPIYQMYTVAGNGMPGSAANGAVATSSSVNQPQGLFLDSTNNNLYFAEFTCVRKVTLDDSISTIVAGGTSGNLYAGENGPATSASFTRPMGVFADLSGVLFVSDFSGNRVRQVSPSGIITLYAGTGDPGVATSPNGDDGPATAATVFRPQLLSVDSSGNLYVPENFGYKVRKIAASNKIITTITGTGYANSAGDGGAATSAAVNKPYAIAVDTLGLVYISESVGNRVRVIDSFGIINLFSGRSDGGTALVDFVASTASGLNVPYGLWSNSIGDLYINDGMNNRLRIVNKFSGLIYTVAGSGEATASQYISEGGATTIPLLKPLGVSGDSNGRLFVSEFSSSIGGSSIRGIYASTQSPTGAPTTAYPTTAIPTFTPTVSLAPSIAPTVPVYQMYTVAGNGVAGSAPDGAVATSSSLNGPLGLFVDSTSIFLYLTEASNSRLRKINLVTGISNVYAGDGAAISSGDGGPATMAQLGMPAGVGGTTTGVIYISDYSGNSVRAISPTGIITNFVGTGTAGTNPTNGNGDGGPATSADIKGPYLLTVDINSHLYFVDFGNMKIRKVNAVTNTISTIAGTGAADSTGDGGYATSATLSGPVDVFIDSSSIIYITDYIANRIRVISADNIITLFAGLASGGVTYGNNVAATSTGVSAPYGVWSDTMGNVYFAVSGMGTSHLRMVSGFSGIVTSIAGTGASSASLFVTNGPALSIPILLPRAVRGASQGRIFVSDASPTIGGSSVRGVYAATQSPTTSPTQSMTPTIQPSSAPTVPVYQMFTVAGNGVPGSAANGAVASSSSVNAPYGLCADTTGTFLYIADYGNRRVRKINLQTGISHVFAGDSVSGTLGDGGLATAAKFILPAGVAGSVHGKVYASDSSAHTIRAVNLDGIITKYIGTSMSVTATALNGDGGQATSASLNRPLFMTVDTSDNIYFADTGNNKVRKVEAIFNIISTVAGTGVFASNGNGGYATSASLKEPIGVFVDSTNRIFISENSGNKIRIISTENTISLFAGLESGVNSLFNNVAATATGISAPNGVWGDSVGNLYFVPSGHIVVRVVSGFSGIVTTIAGTGASSASSFVLAGAALSIPILQPRGVHGDSQGRIYITDLSTDIGGSSVRGVYASTQSPTTSPTTSMSPTIQPSTAPTVPVYQMYTVAGNGVAGSATDGAVATSSSVVTPNGLAIGSGNYLYFVETDNHRVWKIDLISGIMNIVAGIDSFNGGYYMEDGVSATATMLNSPSSVCVSTSGEVFISDTENFRIRKVATDGIISTIVGTGSQSGIATDVNGDEGMATSATIGAVYQLAAHPNSNLFFADQGNNKIRRYRVATRIISTVGGTGYPSSNGDGGAATAASLKRPYGLFVTSDGAFYCTEGLGNRIRVFSNAIIHTIAGGEGLTMLENVPATATGVESPLSLWGNTMGDLFYVDNGNYRVRVISAFSGLVNTVAGSGSWPSSFVSRGVAMSISLSGPSGIAGDMNGNVYISDKGQDIGGNNVRGMYATTQSPTVAPTWSRVPTMVPTSTVPSTAKPTAPTTSPTSAPTLPAYLMFTVAGNGSAGFADFEAVATSSAVHDVKGVYVDIFTGNVLFSESHNRVARAVDCFSQISTIIAGTGTLGSGGDGGPATSAQLNWPVGIIKNQQHGAGETFIADIFGLRIRKIDHISGTIITFAGGGSNYLDGFSATATTLESPQYIYFDGNNDLYFTDINVSVLRKVDHTTTVVTTVAGSLYDMDSRGDGGQASAAAIFEPHGLFIDSTNTIFVSDSMSNVIRRITLDGIINLFAGQYYGSGLSDNVPATSAQLGVPAGIWGNTVGDIFFSDMSNNKIRVVSSFSGLVSSFAGTGGDGNVFVPFGLALSVDIQSPQGVAGDSAGRIFFGEKYAVRGIKSSTVAPSATPSISPTTVPSFVLSITPTIAPSIVPTSIPTTEPTAPTWQPSVAPTVAVYQMYTVAGNGIDGSMSETAMATSAPVNGVVGVFIDQLREKLYFTDSNNAVARVINLRTGIATIIAGKNENPGSRGDNGPATSAQVMFPMGIVLDNVYNNTYIADYDNHKIRKVDQISGIIITYVGTGEMSDDSTQLNGDGSAATSATLKLPTFITVDRMNNLYISDSGSHKIRKVESATFVISTIAGSGLTDGVVISGSAATSADLREPRGLFIDSSDTLYLAEYWGDAIRAIYPDGTIKHVAGKSDNTPINDVDNVPATSASIFFPVGIWGNTVGDIYITDADDPCRLRVISAFSSRVASLAGGGVLVGFVSAGPALDISLEYLQGVSGDSLGRVYFAEAYAVRGIYASTESPTTTPSIQPTAPTVEPTSAPTQSTYQMYTVAGNGVTGAALDNSVATSSSINTPIDLFIESTDVHLYMTEFYPNRRVRKINLQSGIMTVFAGDGTNGNSGDGGPATSAQFKSLVGVAGTTSGVMYFSDSLDSIRTVNPSGIITTLVPVGVNTTTTAFNGDGGAATSASVKTPNLICIDTHNNLFIADMGNKRVRKVDALSGIISTIAGTGTSGSAGDGGYATSAKFAYLLDVFVDSADKIYVSDSTTNRIRTISTHNIISLFVGLTVGNIYMNNVAATATGVQSPYGLWGDTSGNVYYTAIGASQRYLRVVSEFSGIVTTIAGNGATSTSLFVASGPALSIPLFAPRGVVGNSQGRIFVADAGMQFGGSSVRGVYASTQSPTVAPTKFPSLLPTFIPTTEPTTVPSATPSIVPSRPPTLVPSPLPSIVPSPPPTTVPTQPPTTVASLQPTTVPTQPPSIVPTNLPTIVSILLPTIIPTPLPSTEPSQLPTTEPTQPPITVPTQLPSVVLTQAPTFVPTQLPSTVPTPLPTTVTTLLPTTVPTQQPSFVPTQLPTTVPTQLPTTVPSGEPTLQPTLIPTSLPTLMPFGEPTQQPEPSLAPSIVPSITLCTQPSISPSNQSSVTPSIQPSSTVPLSAPSTEPSLAPSSVPTTSPSSEQIPTPTTQPISDPTTEPSQAPSPSPTTAPSTTPSIMPSSQTPSELPSLSPTREPNYTNITSIQQLLIFDGSIDARTQVRIMVTFSVPALITDQPETLVWCGAFVVTNNTYNSPPFTSLNQIRQQGFLTSSSFSLGKDSVNMLLTGLIPASNYRIYCYTASNTDVPVQMPYNIAIKSSVFIATSCCKVATFNSTISSVVIGSLTMQAFSVSLNYAPSHSYLQFSVRIESMTNSNNIVVGSIFPQLVSVSSNYVPNSPRYFTYIAGDAGLFNVSVVMSGHSVDEYELITNGQLTFQVIGAPTITPTVSPSRSPTASPSVDRSLLISTIAGTASAGSVASSGDDGPAMSATFNRLNGIAVDALGHIYVSDSLNNVVRKISSFTGIITTIAGDTTTSLTQIGDGGPATSATLSGPKHLFTELTGRYLFVSDPGNFAVRKVDLLSGIITLFAGNNIMPIAPSVAIGDGGPATSAKLKNPYGLWGDTLNNLFISDNRYNNIRRVDTNGIISTIVGSVSGADGSSGNNAPATSALLYGPIGLWGDKDSQFLFICDYSNLVIRRVDLHSDVVTLFAGQTGLPGSSGDNGPATSAKLKNAISIWGDADMNVFFSDAGNCGLRKVSNGGIISKLSGVYGVCTGQGDNGSPAISATHKFVYQITGDRASTLYLVDGSMRKVRVIYNATSTLSPIAAPTAVPSVVPTSAVPTMSPSPMPTSIQPTKTPSLEPTTLPTQTPSMLSSQLLTLSPTIAPSISKSPAPQVSPRPTKSPTSLPTRKPSSTPTILPTKLPTTGPTIAPTEQPTTIMPSPKPSTVTPTMAPSSTPSMSAEPSASPSESPTFTPTTSSEPSYLPSETPTHEPTVSVEPSVEPTMSPTVAPSATLEPSELPSLAPSVVPSIDPTTVPSEAPSSEPTTQPSTEPTTEPSTEPSVEPSHEPSPEPSTSPSTISTSQPTESLADVITSTPSQIPTTTPSVQVASSVAPTLLPSTTPTVTPSLRPTTAPTFMPTTKPTSRPTKGPQISSMPTLSFAPTFTSTVAPTLPVVHITVGGEIELSAESVTYIIELSENDQVTFTAPHVHTNNSRIVREYKVIPVDAVRIEIETFSNSTDLINLSAFESYSAFTDLHITQGSVIINLPNSQVIKLHNLYPSDVSASNFVFSSGNTNKSDKNTSASLSSVTIGIIAAIVVLIGGGVLWAVFWYVHKTRKLNKKVASLTPIFPVMEHQYNYNGSVTFTSDINSKLAQSDIKIEEHKNDIELAHNSNNKQNSDNIESHSVDSNDLENFDLRSEEDSIHSFHSSDPDSIVFADESGGDSNSDDYFTNV